MISGCATFYSTDAPNQRNCGSLNGGAVHEDALGGIVGSSEALAEIAHHILTVAPTDSTVLIEGETGTGKELIAAAIHQHSSRRTRPLVKMNCAAIPASLLESELFGHEKGAFTGAISRRMGRFEAAHQGTLFLDEIGDMPLELQAKLLRVLQERAFERLGSTLTQHVDVRIVAATNQNLAKSTSEKRFRADLYYRLNVYPIRVAPLRERACDIPLLVQHFVTAFSAKLGRRIERIPAELMDALVRYSWPGNVRELQNVMERAVIFSPGEVLILPPLPEIPVEPVTMEDAQRDHILKALHATNWVVGGPAGAAKRLGMKRTTLIHTMHRRGIVRAAAASATN